MNNTSPIVADNSSSESNDVEFAHMQSRPTTPINQPTKPASTNAPERVAKLTIAIPKPNHTCQGCIEEQPNQMAHVGAGGCLEDFPAIPRWKEQFIKEVTEKKAEAYENEYKCPCYCEGCPGDCGTLWCGCIDVCRGRCGLKGRNDGW